MRGLPTIRLVSDGTQWALDQEQTELLSLEGRLSFRFQTSPSPIPPRLTYFLDRHQFLKKRFLLRSSKSVINFFHGVPSHSSKFSGWLSELEKRKRALAGIRVSHHEMRALLVERGFHEGVSVIPIPVSDMFFREQRTQQEFQVRKSLGLSNSQFVIGSFQKDGQGWGSGATPKYEKGPDLFLDVIRELRKKFDNLAVLLVGPSRGYMENGLSQLGVPFRSLGRVAWESLPSLYRALDIYLVTSRDEGGPKSVLESLASGIPVISTPVGQARDFLSPPAALRVAMSFNPEELAFLVEHCIDGGSVASPDEARMFASKFRIINQVPTWEAFFQSCLKDV